MNKSRSVLLLAVLNSLGFLGTIIINALANILPINDKTTGELSDQYPNLFVPAGLTFSIWGVIYLMLAVFVIYGLIVAIKNDARKSAFLEKISWLFLITSILNIAWIFTWHYENVPLSLLVMLLLLASLITIYLRLNIGTSEAKSDEKYLTHLPFSIYLGWITIATIANVTALLVDIQWNTFGLGDQFWAIAVIIVGVVITLLTLFKRKDIFYCLVVNWALIGILIKRLSVNTVPDQGVIIAAITGLALISIGIIIQLLRRRVY
jgi:hypothetical protein